jgi:hypothetical protein
MKVKMSFAPEYDSKYNWNCFCQGGENGMVLPKGSFDKVFSSDEPLKDLIEGATDNESYITAFFEAFPNNPKCFIRGEGKTIQEAEESCWQKYQKILNCNHEMERRDRKDGYGYCKHCSYSSTVFEPLTKCCKCGKSTSYTQDYKGKWYCQKHNRFKPKNPNPRIWEISDDKRLPRKRKKLLKKCAQNMFEKSGTFGKVKFSYLVTKKFYCNNQVITLLFERQEKEFIKKYKNKF